MLIISRSEVEALLDVDALIDTLAVAMADLSSGRASVPQRNIARVDSAGLLSAMPAYLSTQNVLAAKLVLVFPGNDARGEETHQAVVAVFDPETGIPIALMDGASITAIRTAAGSALATRLCSRKDSKVLAIIGTGVQARAHAQVVPRVRNVTEILVAGRSPEKARAFAAEIGASPTATYAEAVTAADIVCCCTNATDPVVGRECLLPGTHINSVGFSPGPEVDPGLFATARVVVESRSAAIGEFPNGAVDITTAVDSGLLRMSDIREIGELVQDPKAARADHNQITLYRSVGVAAQDAAAAGLILNAAREKHSGLEVDLAP